MAASAARAASANSTVPHDRKLVSRLLTTARCSGSVRSSMSASISRSAETAERVSASAR